jgi:hypothetical protein
MGRVEDLRDEMNRLMREHADSLDGEVFMGRLTEEEYRQRAARLERIRELAADYLAALKRERLMLS